LYAFGTGTGRNLSEGRYTSGGENENELGIILALSLCMSCYLLARNKGFRVLWFLHVPACLVAILLTGSRGSFIAAVLALLMFPCSLGSFSKNEKILGGLALVLVVALGLTFVPATTWDRMGSIQGEISEGTLTKRTYIWSAGLEAYREHPVLGVGAGAFEAGVVKRLDVAYVAHNSYLSVLVELGAVGLILFLALLASLVHAALKLPKTPRTAWIFLLLTWSVAVLSLTWEHRKPTWFLFGLLMAQSAALARPRFRAQEHVAGGFSPVPDASALADAPSRERHPGLASGFAR
jgi:O-antigen ligase